MTHAKHISAPPQERGAALIVALMLLVVLTVLAVSGMSTATLDMALAGNAQYAEDAFQSAESAIEAEFRVGGLPDPTVPRVNNGYQFGNGVTADTRVVFEATRLPPPGYSVSEYQSDHYMITSTGRSAKSAETTNEQGFFMVIPSLGL